MKRSLLLGLLIMTLGQAQTQKYDFLDQVGLIKNLMPEAKIIGVMVGQNDHAAIKDSIGPAQTQSGITIVTIKLNDVKQKVPQYLRMAAAGVVKKHAIDALFFIEGKATVTQNQAGIKFTAIELRKLGIPTFSPNKKGLKLGCFGQFVLKGEEWTLNLNSGAADKLNITIPKDDPRFLIPKG